MTNFIKYRATSPYKNTQQNVFYLDLYSPRNIPRMSTDSFLTIDKQFENRPDLLAYAIYGDTRLWWVFSVRNKDLLKDPIWDLKAGMQIYVTEPKALRDILSI